jgi:FkbM family methyltransferase
LPLDNASRLLLNAAMLSYAQNMEDVVLAGIFAGQDTGFYIDVGGGHAVADNVTFHAYLHGWRGVVVEPQDKLLPLYAAVRPRDVVVPALCGRSVGQAEMFEAERFHGLSTASERHAEVAAQSGAAGRTVAKPMTTLAAICEAHAPATIDVLKIDVEGFEGEVIAGNDWSRFRPRVVIVEAIEPLSMADASHRFEPAVLAAGYSFAYFDNLNRWYVADEAAPLLRARFPAEAPDWDSVAHLGEYGPAHEDARHPEHDIAKRFPAAVLALLPFLGGEALAAHGAADARPDQLARIASHFDGGYLVD